MNHSAKFYLLATITLVLSVFFAYSVMGVIKEIPFGEASYVTIDRDFFQIYETTYPDNAKKKVRWIISHQPERYFLEAALTFKKILEEKTNGEMTVEIITYNDEVAREQSADLRAAAKDFLHEGKADIMQSYIDTELLGYEPRLAVLELPLVFRDYEHINHVVEGPIGEELLNGLSDSPYKALAFTFSGGFLSFYSHTTSLSSLESLHGKTIPAVDNVVSEMFVRELGMIPTTGDEHEIDIRRAVYNDFFADDDRFASNRPERSLLHTRHSVLFTILLMNSEFFASLSPEEQRIVSEAAVIAAQSERAEIEKDEYRFRSLPNQEWVRVLSEADSQLLSTIAEKVTSSITPNLGSELLTHIRETD